MRSLWQALEIPDWYFLIKEGKTMRSIQEMLDTATKTYNGKTGCACGCGGTYADAITPEGQKRIKRMLNTDPARVVFIPFNDAEGCLEIENRDGTRVTRIYVKDAN